MEVSVELLGKVPRVISMLWYHAIWHEIDILSTALPNFGCEIVHLLK
jgi:hypothetical protein